MYNYINVFYTDDFRHIAEFILSTVEIIYIYVNTIYQ